MKVSIIYSTKRWGGLDVLVDSLGSQDILPELLAQDEVELLFVDEHGNNPERYRALCQTAGSLGFHPGVYDVLVPPDYDPPRYGKLCRANNVALERAEGQYLFFHNDLIVAPPDALRRFLSRAEQTPYPLLQTGINHRTHTPTLDAVDPEYRENPELFPESFFTAYFSRARYGFPDVPLFWVDVRAHGYQEVEESENPTLWEANVAFAPCRLLVDCGAWDEELDYGYAFDNCDVAARALARDPRARVLVDRKVVSLSLDHQQYIPDPPRMAEACERNRKIFLRGQEQRAQKRTRRAGVTLLRPEELPVGVPVVAGQGLLKTTNGKSIAFVLKDIGGWAPIDPCNPFAKALGGRESATVQLAAHLGARGWRSVLFAPVTAPGENGCVFSPLDQATPRLLSEFDVVVSIEHPEVFQGVKSALRVLHYQCAHPVPPVGARDALVDAYILLSNYQRWSLRAVDPKIDALKCLALGNGIDPKRYQEPATGGVRKIPGRLTWSSSPDRGLVHLIRWWPKLKAAMPDLSLKVFYNLAPALEPFRWTHELRGDWAREIEAGMNLPDVEFVGPVSQERLAREQALAELFVYPCDPVWPTETYAITVLENLAAGNPTFLSTADCLLEVYRDVSHFLQLPVLDAHWITNVQILREDAEEREKFTASGKALAAFQSWENIAGRWDAYLQQLLALGRENREASITLTEDTQDLIDRERLGAIFAAAPARTR